MAIVFFIILLCNSDEICQGELFLFCTKLRAHYTSTHHKGQLSC